MRVADNLHVARPRGRVRVRQYVDGQMVGQLTLTPSEAVAVTNEVIDVIEVIAAEHWRPAL